jgi:hypothetical protein
MLGKSWPKSVLPPIRSMHDGFTKKEVTQASSSKLLKRFHGNEVILSTPILKPRLAR